MLEADLTGLVCSAGLQAKQFKESGGCLFWFMGLRIYKNNPPFAFSFFILSVFLVLGSLGKAIRIYLTFHEGF
ncbi:hypothetical protein Pint_17264 [Pistacia integerrima]|uniref:Uncharacterized protein n=1 Tax=Pistacia integerrima TaxID=434235 RepID=A0ACC0YXR0_9ROSI|nr:hypothetical protein Pint_17264 [Pistacia integerrima]